MIKRTGPKTKPWRYPTFRDPVGERTESNNKTEEWGLKWENN
jgi:hypothetical protein